MKLILLSCFLGLGLAAFIPKPGQVASEEFEFRKSPNFPFDYKGYPFDYRGYPYDDNYVPQVPRFDYRAHYQNSVPQGFPYNYQYPAYQHQRYHVPQVPQVPKYPEYRPAATQDSFKLTYLGKFSGTCKGAKDGLYFVDSRSFAFCSNGIKAIQSCAEGSANPSYDEFAKGTYKYIYDFCSINLAAQESAHHATTVDDEV